MAKNSIIMQDKVCYFCERTYPLEYHHIYKGGNRKISDRHGFTVWLCPDCHRGTYGVHGKNGHDKDMALKQAAQAEFERLGHTRQQFIDLIGRSYL
jgi:Zn-finger protein